MLLEASHGNVSYFPCCSYPSLRVAYIDEVEKTSEDKSKKNVRKVYYSALVKAAPPTKTIDSTDPVQRLDQVIIFITSNIWH